MGAALVFVGVDLALLHERVGVADRADGEGPFDFTDHALRVVDKLGIDVLIPIGGDDTLSYGMRMHEEGVPVIAIPKTMDNDVFGTDYCIGFGTAITRSAIWSATSR